MVEETIDWSDSGRAFQRDNWKVRPFVHIGHVEVQPGFSRVVYGSIAGDSGEQLHRNLAADALMWPEFVIPGEIESKLKTQIRLSQRDENATGAFGFQGADHTLDDGNGAVFADGAESGLDFPALAPALEGLAPELTAFVGDDVFRGLAGNVNGAAEEGTDLERSGWLLYTA